MDRPSMGIFKKKSFDLKVSGNEVHYSPSSLLIIIKHSCSKIARQFSTETLFPQNLSNASSGCIAKDTKPRPSKIRAVGGASSETRPPVRMTIPSGRTFSESSSSACLVPPMRRPWELFRTENDGRVPQMQDFSLSEVGQLQSKVGQFKRRWST